MKKTIIILSFLIVLVVFGIYFLSNSLSEKQDFVSQKDPIVIGLSMGVTSEERWSRDAQLFIEKVQDLKAEVALVSSGSDVSKQISQIENLISQGVSAIVIVPSDSEKLTSVIDLANYYGVKIIAYDRLIKNSNIDFYISFDNIQVGEIQAKSVLSKVDSGKFAYIGGSSSDNNAFLLKEGAMNILKPKIENGDVELVMDEFIDDWRPETAYKLVKKYLESGKKIDAIIAANDGLASGVIQALKEKKLDGKIPVSGQDAELSAIQRIVLGTQTSTVYKPINSLAQKAAEIAVSLANGQKISTDLLVENGKISVPSILVDPIMVDKNNIEETVIKDGFHSRESIYNLTLD